MELCFNVRTFFQHCLPIQKFSYFCSVSDRLSCIVLRQQVLQGVPNIDNWLEVGKIVTEPRFKLTPLITLSGKASSLTKSLYKQECELDDNFEYDMTMALTGIDSVRW